MKSKELTKIRSESIEDLGKLVDEKRKELAISFADRKAGKEKNLKVSMGLRRDIAQIMTIIREKEISNEEKKKAGESQKTN